MSTQDFQTPVTSVDEPQYQNENAVHYGILVGGVKQLQWNGIGENSIGHHLLNRRTWLPFIRLKVGRRNEFDGALDMPLNTVQLNWSDNAARTRWKSPRECAMDFQHAFGAQGSCIPEVLIGHDDPQGLTERVWPKEIREKLRLFEHVRYFETFQTNDDEEAKLASALLDACYGCMNSIHEQVRMLKDEMGRKQGLKELNEALKELFYEISEPLPEHKTALVASAMGKEIVSAMPQSDGRKDDAMIDALHSIAEGQRAITNRLEKLEGGNSAGNGNYDLTGERPAHIHWKTWQKMRQDAGISSQPEGNE